LAARLLPVVVQKSLELHTNSDRFRREMEADRGRRMVRARLGLAVAGAIALAGCGGDDQKPEGRDLTAVRCPLVATGEQVGGVDRYEPAKDSFDTAELIGQQVEKARFAAAGHGCEVVVAMRDGEGVAVPTDIDPKRIYVYTEHGVVTEIEGVGGGI
jgi:hypothetical protein